MINVIEDAITVPHSAALQFPPYRFRAWLGVTAGLRDDAGAPPADDI